jgi:hypothetical protein
MGGTGALASCDGKSLLDDATVDLDLKLVTLTGKLLVNGAPMPTEADFRGFIDFNEVVTGFGAAFNLDTTGTSYALALPPGTYDVVFQGNDELCQMGPLPGVPCGSAVLLHAIELTADKVLDIDVPAVTVSGAITLDGKILPDAEMERGQVWLNGDGAEAYTTVGATGPGAYSLRVVPGTYDVTFAGSAALCASSPTGMPCNAAIVKSGAAIDDGTLDLDLHGVTITGSVTVNGQTMPDATQSRGGIYFVPAQGQWANTHLFEATGPATYEITLFPGVYDILYLGNPQLCSLKGSAPSLPCNTALLASSVDLTQGGVHDLDLKPITLSGNLTLNGQPFPAGVVAPVEIDFAQGENAIFSARFDVTGGNVSYALTLVPGSYDLTYLANLSACGRAPALGLPCNNGKLAQNLVLDTSRVLDIDIPGVRITGNVTVNGAPMRDESGVRGYIMFAGSDGTTLSTALQPTGAASYAVTLLPGSYDLAFSGNDALCAGGATPGVPCIGAALQPNVALSADGTLDLDVPLRHVNGRVTLNGQPLPDADSSRGKVWFAGVGAVNPGEVDLGMTGAGVYAVTLVPGNFLLMHDANPTLCQEGGVPKFPCASQLLAGCN